MDAVEVVQKERHCLQVDDWVHAASGLPVPLHKSGLLSGIRGVEGMYGAHVWLATQCETLLGGVNRAALSVELCVSVPGCKKCAWWCRHWFLTPLVGRHYASKITLDCRPLHVPSVTPSVTPVGLTCLTGLSD